MHTIYKLYSLQVGGFLNFVLPYDLTTTELEAIAPQLIKLYPSGTPIQLRLYIGNILQSSFETNNQDVANLNLPLYMEFSPIVVNNDTNETTLDAGFTLEMMFEFDLTLEIVPNDNITDTSSSYGFNLKNSTQLMKGEVEKLEFVNVTVIESNVGQINDQLFMTTLDGVLEVMEVSMNVLLSQGFPLPSILKDTSLYFQNGETEGATDFELNLFDP